MPKPARGAARIAGPKPAGQVKWIACSGGLLAALAGEADVVTPISYQTIADNPIGRTWPSMTPSRAACCGKIPWRATSMSGSSSFATSGSTACCKAWDLVCRELRTGKTVWTNSDPSLQAEFHTPATELVRELLVSQPALLATDDVLLLKAKWVKNTAVLSRADGKLLWKKPTFDGSYRALTALAVNGLWIGGGEPTGPENRQEDRRAEVHQFRLRPHHGHARLS